VKFVGREAELQTLHQMLQQDNQVAIAAIAGMGGLGKTELALQYAMAHREIYKGGICWLLAKAGDVGIQVVQFARTQLDLNPPENLTEDSQNKLLAQVQYCWRHWHEGDVLVVLDDVAQYKEVKPYLPPSFSRFKVLMTTRQRLGKSIKQLSLDVLQPEAALELLQSLIGAERLQKELDVANSLCKWLGYLPLGLELVGRYLCQEGQQDLSLAKMLQRLEKKRLEQTALVEREDDMTAQWGVQAAFELSWQELKDSDKQMGCLLSLFAAAPILWKLVELCLPEEDEEDLEKIRNNKLLKLHLLQRKGEGIYQLHPLLREFFQYKCIGLEQAEELKRSLCRVMVAVAKEIPQNPILEQITIVSPAIPHIAEVANNLIQYVNDNDLTGAFIGNARFYDGQGLYNQALPWYKQCLEASKKRLGQEHSDVAESLNNLALLYNSQGRYSKAEPLFIEALALWRRLLGEEHLDVALSLNNLAALYNSQGRYDEAEPLFLQALQLRRRLLGEEHTDVALSLNNLAAVYISQGKYSEAEPLLEQALELWQRLLGEEHPYVALNLNNLASSYDFQGKYSKAEPLYLQALTLRQRLLGEEHPDVAFSLNNLASFYNSQGRYDEAEPLLKKALQLWRSLLGEEHPYVALSLNNLAFIYYSQRRFSEAEPLYLQALALRRQLLGEEHPDVALSLNNLAKLYYLQGRYTQAEPLYIKALKIFEQQLGVNHPHTVKCCESLADLRDRLPLPQ